MTPLVGKSPVNLDDVRVEREYATSKDGTKIPVNILVPKRVELDGKAPCLVTGYGGYNISLPPAFNPARRVLFDHGMVVAVVNLRGGSEFGEEWHDAGRLTREQRVCGESSAAFRRFAARK